MKPSDFFGAWNLVDHGEISSEGKYTPTAKEMDGQILYSSEGYMSVYITLKRKPESPKDLIAYCGPFSVKGNEVTHHVRLSVRAEENNKDKVRIAELKGNLLTLTTPVTPKGFSKIVWKRAPSRDIL